MVVGEGVEVTFVGGVVGVVVTVVGGAVGVVVAVVGGAVGVVVTIVGGVVAVVGNAPALSQMYLEVWLQSRSFQW